MWASSKSPEIPTSANWVCSHKTFDKEKSPGRFYPIIMSWERYKKYYLGLENMGFGLDVSRVEFGFNGGAYERGVRVDGCARRRGDSQSR